VCSAAARSRRPIVIHRHAALELAHRNRPGRLGLARVRSQHSADRSCHAEVARHKWGTNGISLVGGDVSVVSVDLPCSVLPDRVAVSIGYWGIYLGAARRPTGSASGLTEHRRDRIPRGCTGRPRPLRRRMPRVLTSLSSRSPPPADSTERSRPVRPSSRPAGRPGARPADVLSARHRTTVRPRVGGSRHAASERPRLRACSNMRSVSATRDSGLAPGRPLAVW
jgi:hypothetical protein